MLEALFLASVVVVPLLLGAVASYLAKPWWWAAVAAVVVLALLAIAPTPEQGEPRVAADDVVFLLVLSVVGVALVWAGAQLTRRRRRPRRSAV